MNPIRRANVALFIAVLVAASGCTDRSPLAPAAPAPNAGLFGDIGDATGLLACTPLPADSASETIGPAGGVLYVGPHRLIVPAGALDAPVTITAVAPSDSVNQVRFQPEGLTFAEPAYLTLSYANCNLLGSVVPKRIAYTTDALDILEFLPSFDNLWARRVTGRLEHFSTYAVAW
jgi:hypothetical protein